MCFKPRVSQTSCISLFLNSDPLSEYPAASAENTIYIVSVKRHKIVSAFLFLMGTAMVNPVSMSITVNTYLFSPAAGRVNRSHQNPCR